MNKQLFRGSLFLIVCTAIVGCSKELQDQSIQPDGNARNYTFKAVQGESDSSTKTVIENETAVYWSPNDSICIFYGNAKGKFISTNTTPVAQTEFKGSFDIFSGGISVGVNPVDFWAVYPYQSDAEFYSNAVKVTVPSVQTAAEGTFAPDLFPAIAKSSNTALSFNNVCGGIRFTLCQTGIRKIVFTGNNNETLAGIVKVQIDEMHHPLVSAIVAGEKSITLVAPDNGEFQPGKWYYFSSLPVNLTSGFSFEFIKCKDESLRGTRSFTAAKEIKRSVFGSLENLDIDVIFLPITAVDLGLSVKWANCNLGASKPEEYGDYFAWGEIETKYEEGYAQEDPQKHWKAGFMSGYCWWWSNYKWCNGSDVSMTKYCTNSSFGTVDNKTTLEPMDDAAHAILKGKWRMPTAEEFNELVSNCICEWTIVNNVNGYLISGNGNSIFLPASGARNSVYLYHFTKVGLYWTSSLYLEDSASASFLEFDSGSIKVNEEYRRLCGFSVRPVIE